MINCVSCSTLNLTAAQYCDLCGASLSVAANEKVVQSQIARSAVVEDDNRANSNMISAATPNQSLMHNHLVANAVGKQEMSAETQVEISEPTAAAHSRLIIERGKNAGKDFVLSEDETCIGRWDADNGVFPDVDLDADDREAKVSRRHAKIVRQHGQYTIQDLNSTNGTFVNRGRRLSPGAAQILNDGDEIIVGKTFLRFQIIR